MSYINICILAYFIMTGWYFMNEIDKLLPRYLQIKFFLLEKIEQMPPDEKIPSEHEIAEKFSVSRGTVKQAVMELVAEDRLYRVQGKGTFVAKRKVQRSFDMLPTFTNDVKHLGQSGCRIISFGFVPASQKQSQFFSIPEGEKIARFKRIIELDKSPLALVSSYINPILYPGLAESDIGESLYASLREKYGFCPVKANDTYCIATATRKTASLLGCRENEAVLFSERFAYIKDGTPAEYVESYIRGDRFKLDIKIGFNND